MAERAAILQAAKWFGTNSPKKGVEWASSIKDSKQRIAVLKSIAASWANQDIEKATAWASSLEKAEKTEALSQIALKNVRKNAKFTNKIMDSIKGEDGYQKLLTSYLNYLPADASPETVLSQISNIDDKTKRDWTYRRKLKSLAYTSPDASLTWMEANKALISKDIVEWFSKEINYTKKK